VHCPHPTYLGHVQGLLGHCEFEHRSSARVLAQARLQVRELDPSPTIGGESFRELESVMAPTLRDALEAVRSLTLTLDHTHTRANARTVRGHEVPNTPSTAAVTTVFSPRMFSLPGQPSSRSTASSGEGAIVTSTAAAGVGPKAPAVLPPRCGHRHRDGLNDSASRLHRNFSNRLHHAQREQIELIQVSFEIEVLILSLFTLIEGRYFSIFIYLWRLALKCSAISPS